MHVSYLVLADAAAAENGKHYIHGAGWDQILAASFPVVHPTMSVALRLQVPWHDTNQPHELEIDVVDEDHQSILPVLPGLIRGTVTTGRPPNLVPGADQFVPLVVNIAQLKFDRAGTHAVIVRIDGMEVARAAFHVGQLHRQALVNG